MRTSRICLIVLLSTLVVQISSETTELDKLFNKITSSTFEVVAVPYKHIANQIAAKTEIDKFLKEFTYEVKRTMEQTQDGLFNLLPKEERQQKKKLLGYLSMYASEAFSKAAKVASTVTNKSFDTLPDDIKNKLLAFGNDINDSLRKVKVTIDDESKTPQKNHEE
ncbi:uncharacterized protein LOC114133094 [Aphis gossypii]|uniref:Uncharacterized protein n=1 Tax=Aphis gossypii TaxID=80765 RepID=A0A9P0NCU2_APHGO|nr:uncharacterized protein LOC114133094 [Aphis gossypii]CAH1710566.1 unnamed protein product [Aphis gossypii]